MDEHLLDADSVCELVSMSKSWLRKAWKHGNFPAPLHLGRRAQRWRRSDVEAWIEQQTRAEVHYA